MPDSGKSSQLQETAPANVPNAARGTCDIYEQQWNPDAYLRQYYQAALIAGDERVNFTFLLAQLNASQSRFQRAIEVGCGPTLHHAAALVPYVDELHLADYLPSNLEAVKRWLENDKDAHNWDVYFRGLLMLEGNTNPAALDARKALLRQKLTALKHADIRREHPLGDNSLYDLVASYYCVEAVASTPEEWYQYLGHLCGLVAPGGTLLLGVMRHCHTYHVFDKVFPSASVDETDLARALVDFGFQADTLQIQAAESGDWAEQGFDGICCVMAQKP